MKLVCLSELVDDAVELHAPLFPDIKFEVDHSLDLSTHTYRAGLLRAVSNLISNAGKYAKFEVLICIKQSAQAIMIEVDDDGAGIAAADREIVFDPFKRLATNSQPGTGLGLALVRRICRRLGGEVSIIDSELGGACFQIQLPRRPIGESFQGSIDNPTAINYSHQFIFNCRN